MLPSQYGAGWIRHPLVIRKFLTRTVAWAGGARHVGSDRAGRNYAALCLPCVYNGLYGYFRDELDYLACGHHLV